MAACEHCERLRSAVRDASRVHHNLLAILEVALDDFEPAAAGIQNYVTKALVDLEEAIRALNEHERSHR
jgi:hypothetical protein